jgi:hypothetical protein
MDPAASVAAAPTAGRGPKKQPKARKLAKDMTPDERRIESEKRAGRREAIKICQQAARLDEERRQETERYLAAQALANSKELAGKAAVHAVMLMKQEALNVAFGGAASVPPPHSVAGASSTSSVTSTLSGRPPLEPNTPGAHSPALGAHAMTGGALPVARLPPDVVRVSRACHRPQPDTVDRGHHPGMRKEASPHLYKKHAEGLFDNVPEQVPTPTKEVMAHPPCQSSLPVGSNASQKLVMADARARSHGERW